MDYRVILRVEGPEETVETEYGTRDERKSVVQIEALVSIAKAQEIASSVHRLLAGVDLRTTADA